MPPADPGFRCRARARPSQASRRAGRLPGRAEPGKRAVPDGANRRQRARDGRAENEGGDGEQVDKPRGAPDAEDGARYDEAAGDLGDEEAEQRNERASIDVSGDIPEGWRQELAGSLRQRRGGRRLIHASSSFRVARSVFFAHARSRRSARRRRTDLQISAYAGHPRGSACGTSPANDGGTTDLTRLIAHWRAGAPTMHRDVIFAARHADLYLRTCRCYRQNRHPLQWRENRGSYEKAFHRTIWSCYSCHRHIVCHACGRVRRLRSKPSSQWVGSLRLGRSKSRLVP